MKKRLSGAVLGSVVALTMATMLSGCTASTSTSSPTPPPATRKAALLNTVDDTSIPSAGCGSASTLPLGRTVTERISTGGKDRSYVLHIPAKYDDSTALPLILAFHARAGDGAGMARYTQFSQTNAIVAYPNGIVSHGERSWESAPYASGANDVAFVSDVITHLQSQLCIDPDRIYAAGKSNGGGFTALLACDLPHRIAAFGIVSGAFYDTASARCKAPTPTPIVEFHGTADPVIHYAGGTSHGTRYPSVPTWLKERAAIDGCSPEATATRIGSDVVSRQWNGCSGRSTLVHYRIEGGGHTWPGAPSTSGPGKTTQTISATNIMMSFFAAHPLTA